MKKRIFTAIDISVEARQKAAVYIENLRCEFPNLRVGWDKPEKLHLTLKFLGDVDETQLSNLIKAVEETARHSSDFKLRITGTGAFPSQRNARVLWLGIDDEKGNLQKLNEILEAECKQKGFTKEKRIFKPHLTIARLRESHQNADLIETHLRKEFESEEFNVSGITIYESHRQKTGSIYSIISINKFDVSIVRRSA